MTPDIRLNYSIETWSFEGHGNILKFAWTPLQREANEIRPFFLFSLKPLDFLFSFDSRKSYGDEKLFLFFFSSSTNNFDDGYGIHLSSLWKIESLRYNFFPFCLFFFFRSLFYLELKSHEISISRILSVQWLGLLSFSNIYPWNTWSVRCLYWNETGSRSMRLRMGWKYTRFNVISTLLFFEKIFFETRARNRISRRRQVIERMWLFEPH